MRTLDCGPRLIWRTQVVSDRILYTWRICLIVYERTVSAPALMGQCEVLRVSSESRRVENKAVKMGTVYHVEWWYWKSIGDCARRKI